ncbi:hypothetical protein WJX72_011669 [[Myrmecia] bisecta]|uniref:Uncharacterized protein n=1 Tax=[Myrmecia] bisecta TaxID=41462 RepID=A0AAW1R9T1_9CHLO
MGPDWIVGTKPLSPPPFPRVCQLPSTGQVEMHNASLCSVCPAATQALVKQTRKARQGRAMQVVEAVSSRCLDRMASMYHKPQPLEVTSRLTRGQRWGPTGPVGCTEAHEDCAVHYSEAWYTMDDEIVCGPTPTSPGTAANGAANASYHTFAATLDHSRAAFMAVARQC